MTTALATVAYIASWDERLIYLLTSGEARTERMSGWMQSYCTGDRTALADGVHCADVTCQECFVAWRNTEVTTQGSIETWHNREMYAAHAANMTRVNELQRALADMQEQLAGTIAISKVQEVGAKYAEYQEWCGVYEQAFEELGIPVLDTSCEVRVTLTFTTTVTADRRQRRGDIDFMRQSLVNYRVAEHLTGLDIFDHDYEMSSPTDIEIELEEA